MKSSVLALALAGGAAAHTTLWNILVNGKDQGVGKLQGGYIDYPPNNNPVKDVTSSAMTCNVPSIKAARSVDVLGGDEIAFQWYHDTNSPSDDIIASSHHGPIMVYISKAGSSLSWVKLWQDGHDGSKWAVDKLIAGSYTGKPGQHKITLPKLAPGEYILRPELIGLHEGNNLGGSQFYMECVHIKVGGSGTVTLPAGVSIPGAYKANDPGVLFNIYTSFSSYPVPGPAVWNGASGGTAPVSSAAPVVTPARTTLATVTKSTPTPTPATGGTVPKYGQCGGANWTGPTVCASGSTCTKSGDYYSQCL